MKIVNGGFLIGLLLLFLSMLDRMEYAEVVISTPVFFGDIVLYVLVSIGPIVIVTSFIRDSKVGIVLTLLFVLSVLFASIGYFSNPSVRKEMVLEKVVEVERAIHGLKGSNEYYQGDSNAYNLYLAELEMFHSIYDSQFKYLSMSERQKDPRSNRMTYFFGLLSGLCIVNFLWSIFHLNIIKEWVGFPSNSY
jgi:hypothetical protein